MSKKFDSYFLNFWAKSFQKHLGAQLEDILPERGELMRLIQRRSVAFYQDFGASASDMRERMMMGYCCIVLAAYRELLPHVSGEQAFQCVQTAFLRTCPDPMLKMYRFFLKCVPRPLKLLSNNRWLKVSRWLYGTAVEFEQEEGPEHVDLIVRRCAIHHFFMQQGAGHLTRVFCGADRIWMDGIDEVARGIRSERPTTLSTGGDCCRFRVVSTDGPTSSTGKQDIILDQTPHTEH